MRVIVLSIANFTYEFYPICRYHIKTNLIAINILENNDTAKVCNGSFCVACFQPCRHRRVPNGALTVHGRSGNVKKIGRKKVQPEPSFQSGKGVKGTGLAAIIMQNGPFDRTICAVWSCKTGRFTTPNGTFQLTGIVNNYTKTTGKDA